ncbi:MAG: hypothetical protein QNJ40_21000 [Xanthomonadales bacterium]|nr:hypothetical protein [Xanthomonadales bacterium]
MSISEQQLLQRLAALPRERDPGKDLWPAISARLERRQEQVAADTGSWRWPQAVAVALVAALGLSVLQLTGVSEMPGAEPGSPLNDSATAVNLELSAPLRGLKGMEGADSELTGEMGDAVRMDLLVIQQATEQVKAALENDPESSFLAGMLADLQRKELSVLRELVLLTGMDISGFQRSAS